jgi:hypothetical protein
LGAASVTERSTEIRAELLLELSEEVSRLAATLARLGLDTSGAQVDAPPDAREGDVPLELVNCAVRARRLRDRYFPRELFADPAWGMMLHLLRAEMLHRRVSLSSLCMAAALPPATGQRWVKALVDHGLVIQRLDPIHLGRAYLELSRETSTAMRRYFAELRKGGHFQDR